MISFSDFCISCANTKLQLSAREVFDFQFMLQTAMSEMNFPTPEQKRAQSERVPKEFPRTHLEAYEEILLFLSAINTDRWESGIVSV